MEGGGGVLQFVFNIIHKAEEQQKWVGPGTHHINDITWTQGGCGGEEGEVHIQVMY